MKLPDSLLVTRGPAAGCLIRLMTGGIFFIEGLLKFLEPADLGAGRFAKIGLPAPEFFGPFVGGVEIVGGLLILAGLGVRLAAIPLLGVMAVAFVSVKVPILLGRGVRLWDGLEDLHEQYDVQVVSSPSGVTRPSGDTAAFDVDWLWRHRLCSRAPARGCGHGM